MKLRHQHSKGELRLEDRKDLRSQRKETECEDQAQLQPANERERALVRREAEQVGNDRLVHMTLHGAFCVLTNEIAFSSNYLILTTHYTCKPIAS